MSSRLSTMTPPARFTPFRWFIARYDQPADTLRMLVLALLYFALAKISLTFAMVNGNATVLWLPSGLALPALLVFGKRLWPGVFVGSFAISVMIDNPHWLSAVIAAGNTLETLIGAWLLQKAGFQPDLKRLKDYFHLVLYGALAATLVSGLFGPVGLLLAGFITSAQYPSIALLWWMGDVMGILVLTPVLLIWKQPINAYGMLSRILEIAALSALTWYVGMFVFTGHAITTSWGLNKEEYLIIPIILWTALRFGRHGLSILLPTFFTMSLWGIAHHQGLFADDFAKSGLLNFWFFHLISNVSAMAVGIIFYEKHYAQLQEQGERALLREVIDAIPDFVFLKTIEGRYKLTNKAFQDYLGLSNSEITGFTPFDVFSPETAKALIEQDHTALQQGSATHQPGWLTFKSGQRELYDIRKVPMRGLAGNNIGVVSIYRNITSETAAEEERNLLYKAVSSSLDEIYIFDAHTLHFFFVNEGALKNLGYSRDEIYGLTPLDIKPSFTQAAFRQLVAPLIAGEKSVQLFETIHRRKNGSRYPVEVHLQYHRSQERSHFMAIIQDITKRQASEQLYRSLLHHASDAILIADARGVLEEINVSGEKLLGYTRDELCGKSVEMIHPAEEMPAVRQRFEQIFTYNVVEPLETRIIRKDGSIVEVEIRPTLIEIGGRKLAQGLFIDRTQRKLQEHRRLAEEKSHRDTLVREVHHRIKNNLQGVTGVLRQFAERHPELSESLNQAISQVQSVAVIHGLQGRASATKVRPCELTLAIAAGIESLWHTPVTVKMLDCYIPCTLAETEAVPIALVLNELILNAIKHGAPNREVIVTLNHAEGINSIKLSIKNVGSIPAGFGLENTSAFGTGLQLVASLLPRTGAKLTWTQHEEIVMTMLELDTPVIAHEPVNAGAA